MVISATRCLKGGKNRVKMTVTSVIKYCQLQYDSCLNELCCLPNIVRVIKSRRMRWGDVARMGERRGVYRFLVGKTEGKRPLMRPMRRWEDNIKMNIQEVGWGAMDWMELARIETDGGHVWLRYWTFGFHKIWGISWLSENLLASQEGLCAMEYGVSTTVAVPTRNLSNLLSWVPPPIP